MKKTVFILLFGMLFGSQAFTQTAEKVSSAGEWTWFGIDYTQCYFIPKMDFPSVSDLKAKISAWNDLVLSEREKYITKALGGKNVNFYLDVVTQRNEKIDVRSRLSDDPFLSSHLNPEKVQEVISSYNIPKDKSGIGLVFVAESYSKTDDKGAYYVTFFDMATKKVLITKRMLGKTRGFGLRNYWANTYYVVLKEVGKKYSK